jgi:hypothetical protein
MGVDPVDFQVDNLHSFNRYTYTNNNPYRYIDPDGNYAFLIPLAMYALTALAAVVTVQSTIRGGGNQAQADVSIGSLSFPGADVGDSAQWHSGKVHNETPEDALTKGRREHGEKRAEEAKTDKHRQVGDTNRIIEDGKRYVDSDSGHNVNVKGDRVVITDQRGNTVSQFKNSRKNTNSRVASGRWIPMD